MEENITIGKKDYIRNVGKDEYWLQDIIYSNPSVLGLGDLIPVSKEKKQSTGGRLDIQLKDPTNNKMYECEIMLGETDPSHIIRAIEYWDIEKKRFPQRQHFAVLVAENFNRRYFNVIQALGLNIPLIAIQVELLNIKDNKQILHFTKIMNVYEEPEENETANEATEETWQKNAKWTLETANEFEKILFELEPNFEKKYLQSYISLGLNGKKVYSFGKKASPRSYLSVIIRDDEKKERIKQLVDQAGLIYGESNNEIYITVDKRSILKEKELFIEIHKIKIPSKTNPADDE